MEPEKDENEKNTDDASEPTKESVDQPVEQSKDQEPAKEPTEEPEQDKTADTQDKPSTDEEPEESSEPETPPEETPEPEEPKDDSKAAEEKPKAKDKKGPAGKGKGQVEDENPDFKYMIRVANTNIEGNYTIPLGLAAIKGVGIRIGIAITDKLGLPRNKRIGDMTDEEVEKLDGFVEELNNELPGWMMNRQKDFETGEDLHITSSEIQRSLRDDLNRLKKIRCYRGIRHEQGQKVRGQRTRANGRTGMTVGVMKKRVRQQQAAKSGK